MSHLVLCGAWNGTQGTVWGSKPSTHCSNPQPPGIYEPSHKYCHLFSQYQECIFSQRAFWLCMTEAFHLSILQEQFLDVLHWIGALLHRDSMLSTSVVAGAFSLHSINFLRDCLLHRETCRGNSMVGAPRNVQARIRDKQHARVSKEMNLGPSGQSGISFYTHLRMWGLST